MDKTTKHNKTEEAPPKVSAWYSEAYFFNPFRKQPINDGWLDKLALDLLEWSKKSDSLMFEQFWNSRGVDDADFTQWLERNQDLKSAYNYARRALYIRREIGTIKKKFNPQTTHFTMAHYSKVWEDLETWRSTLNKKQEEITNTEPKIVVIERFPGREDYIPSTRTPEEVAQEASIKNKPSVKKE